MTESGLLRATMPVSGNLLIASLTGALRFTSMPAVPLLEQEQALQASHS